MILLNSPSGADPQNSSLAKYFLMRAWSATTTQGIPPIEIEYTFPYLLAYSDSVFDEKNNNYRDGQKSGP